MVETQAAVSLEATVGLTAVIVAVTDEVPRVLVVRHTAPGGGAVEALPAGPFTPSRHRTLESGLRAWVEEQTGLPLAYVEQLYTFGDRYRDPREVAGGPRGVTVGYIALVRQAPLSGTGAAAWRPWYDFLPWEDWRNGRPPVIDQAIRPALLRWAETPADAGLRQTRLDRLALAFSPEDAAWDWDMERALERYELLYEAGLVAEAARDQLILFAGTGQEPPIGAFQTDLTRLLGAPLALDNRRMLAVALGRLRGKLKYRPLVFELLPPTFTLYQLQRLVEALSGVRLHKQNFRRLVISGGLVEPTGQVTSQTGGRPAELYRFRREVLKERLTSGVGLPALRTMD